MKVRPCTQHRVWAIGPVEGDNGARRASQPAWAVAGSLVSLKVGAALSGRTLTVLGLKAWADAAPFRVRLLPGGIDFGGPSLALSSDGFRQAPVLPAAGGVFCELPPLPDGRVQVDILDKSNEVVFSRSIPAGSANPKLTVPPPHDVSMRVLSSDGEAIAGAVIRQGFYAGNQGSTLLGISLPSRWLWRTVGTTDADGRLVARVPSSKPLFQVRNYNSFNFLAEKPGYKAAFSGIKQAAYWNGKEVDGDVKEVRFTLATAAPREGRIVLGAQTPLAEHVVIAGLRLQVTNLKGTGSTSWEMPWSLQTDADGRFVIPDAAGLGDYFRLAMHGPEMTERLVAEELRRQTPLQFVALHPRRVDTPKPVDINLSGLSRLQLKFATPAGSPAGGTSLMLLSSVGDFKLESSMPRSNTDVAGRVTLLVERGKWHLFARHGNAMFHKSLQVDGDLELKPTLVPMPTMRGRVVDGDGQPVVGARLSPQSASYLSGDGDPVLSKIANSCNWNWISQTHTDENGEFACAWLDLPGIRYEVAFGLGDRKSKRFQLKPEDGRKVLVR